MSYENTEMENKIEEQEGINENVEIEDTPRKKKHIFRWLGLAAVIICIIVVGAVYVHNMVEQNKFEVLADGVYSDILKRCQDSQDYFVAIEEIEKFKSEHQEYEEIITQKFKDLYLEIDSGLQELSENDYLRFEEISKSYLETHEESVSDKYVIKIKELKKRALSNILSANGLNFNDIQIIKSQPLSNVVDENGDAIWSFVFGKGVDNGSGMYFSAAVDLQNKKMASIEISNPFLFSVWTRLLISGTETENERFHDGMKECIEKGGFDYFKDNNNSLEFMRNFTSQNTINYKQWVTEALNTIYSEATVNKWKSNDGFCVLFERGTAVPKVFTYKTMVNEYQWGYLYPESHLGYLDRQTRSIFTSEFGPAYEEKEKWVAIMVEEDGTTRKGSMANGKDFDSLAIIKNQCKVEE